MAADGKKSLSTLDRSFLAAESRDVMMHVGALLEFAPPNGGSGSGSGKKGAALADFSRELREELARTRHVTRPWNLHLNHPDVLKSPVQAWVPEENVDLDYHVRRSALASPGDERELGILVSRLHGTPLDFHHPPWEAHFIEGLEGKRLAMYFKVHHSLIDGYTGMRLLAHSLSTDPNDVDRPLFFELDPPARKRTEDPAPTLAELFGAARAQISVTKDVGRALMSAVRSRKSEDESKLALPLQAPKSVLNQRISRSRRFATQRVSIDRVKAIATRSGGTLNDVILAICGSALRRFLREQDALPDKPLVAMVPVNIRPKDDEGGGGNAVGAILASLATDVKDARKALDVIIASTKRAKAQLQGMSKNAIMQYSSLLLAPMMLSFIPGAAGRIRPAFNVVISNVPGPETPLYLRGWQLEEMYPLSIPFHGYGLNITVQSYAGTLNFGFTGCRDTLPHLQHLAIYSGEALEALEETK